MLKQLLLIGAGGFIGSVARYLVSRLNTRIEWFAIELRVCFETPLIYL